MYSEEGLQVPGISLRAGRKSSLISGNKEQDLIRHLCRLDVKHGFDCQVVILH
jgi:hypothetical protein